MSIRINGKKYRNGTVVRANPVEEATGTLEKIGIGSDVYEIQGSGGGSSGVYVEDELYTATSNSFVDITVDWEWKDYDLYIFRVHDTYSENGDTTTLTKGQISSMVSSGNHQYFFRFGSSNCSYVFTSSQLTARANGDGLFIEQIVGIKVSGDYYSPVIYSTEEREIGVWTDNKPLYQKTVAVGALPNTTTKTVAHNISNIAFIAKVYGTAYSSTNGYTLPLEDTDADAGISGVIRVFANSTNVFISTKRDQSEYDVCFVTLQYTKTTDVAGSGSYNTLGVPTVHYSTNEQVIGTWIDGKPLYEKTFTGLSQATNGVDWVTVQGVNIPSIKDLINATAWASGGTGEQIKITLAECSAVNDGVRVNVISSAWDRTINKMTVQYTKTTD